MEISIVLPLAGFVVGVIVGMTGVGGGALMTPILVFGLGVPPAVAVGTDLVFAGLTKSIGVWVHGLGRNIDWATMRLLALGSLSAALLLIKVLDRLPSRERLDAAVLPFLGGALLLTAVVVALRSRVGLFAERFSEKHGRIGGGWIVLAGAVLGGLVTLSSVGAGALGVAVLMICRPQMRPRHIVGTDLAHALPLALVAGLGHWTLGTVDFGLLAALLLGSLPGIYLGSSLTGRVPEPVLRSALTVGLVAAGLMCII